MSANELRQAFTRFFVERAHTPLPPAGLIPHDPSVMFTIAGMVQFKPYFIGEATPPSPRATTIQPCFRMIDIDEVGQTARHATFFEMLGNFSFGDYFKELAIPYAWELVTEVLGFDPERLWVTVHESDTDATGIWQETAHLPAERIQKMGEDNFWTMGETGPCGPSSEIFFDRGERYGDPGGPAFGGDDRYIEIWNLVFMQYERLANGDLIDLPRRNIDTGAGLERIVSMLQGVETIFETDLFAPVIDEAAALTKTPLGAGERSDIALRILADHARAMTFLISDGVFPTNEGRGYVLRRVIRRAVLRAQQLGVSAAVTPRLVETVISTMANAYPKLERDRSLIVTIVSHEEEAFRRTLRAGTALLENELAGAPTSLSGDVAFRLHDTYGFPIDLTEELAGELGVTIDREGFDDLMSEQRSRARQSARATGATGATTEWRSLIAEFGPTEFVGYREQETSSRVLSVSARPTDSPFRNIDGESPPDDVALFDVVLDVTPFYAEGGGQVGDTGFIEATTGALRVLDTIVATEGLITHVGYFVRGAIEPGAEVHAVIDAERRNAIRRNHTATHLLHHALRHVLGEHVQQQGSLVAPDRLRFDFNHFTALTRDEIDEIEEIVNREILTDSTVRTYETTRVSAEEAGAIAFFGEKYGDVVRVVEAGDFSVELCGGTHVSALGMIGTFRITSESSTGANTRRIEATTGMSSFEAIRRQALVIEHAATALRSTPAELETALAKVIERQRELEDELRKLRSQGARDDAHRIAAQAVDGRVVERMDDLDPNALRELALAVRAEPGIDAVALIGAAAPDRVALVVATTPDSGLNARSIAAEAAVLVGGGGGGSAELATAGGRDVAAIDTALSALGGLIAKAA